MPRKTPPKTWISWAKHPSLFDDLIEVEDDGTGQPMRCRAPSPRFDTVLALLGDKLRYRLVNSPRNVGERVKFAMPVEGVDEGFVIQRRGGYVDIQVAFVKEMVTQVIEVERLENEVRLVSDLTRMAQWGRT